MKIKFRSQTLENAITEGLSNLCKWIFAIRYVQVSFGAYSEEIIIWWASDLHDVNIMWNTKNVCDPLSLWPQVCAIVFWLVLRDTIYWFQRFTQKNIYSIKVLQSVTVYFIKLSSTQYVLQSWYISGYKTLPISGLGSLMNMTITLPLEILYIME